MSERRDDEEPANETNIDVDAGNANTGGPVQSQSNEERPPDEDFGTMATVETGPSSSVGKTETDQGGYFGPRQKRLITYSCLLLWISIFVFPRWSQYGKAPNPEWRASFKLHIGGALVILIATFIIAIMAVLEGRNMCENRLVKITMAGILLFGGFLYWVGGIQFAKKINDRGMTEDKQHRYHLSGWAGSAFIEATFIAIFATLLAADYVTNFMSRSERLRVYLTMNMNLMFTALVAFFSYAAWRGYTTDYPIKVIPNETRCVAAGWFFILFATVYWFVVEFVDICCKCSASAQRVARESTYSVKMSGIVILLFGGLLVLAGMWAVGNVGDEKWNCYYVGYGFFVFFYCWVMAFDFYLGRVIANRRK
jgi:hypothetical protein